MRNEDLYRTMNDIDDSYIIDAQRFPGRKPPTVRWIVVRCALAAVLAVAILTGILWSAGNSATFLGFQRKFLRISYNNGSLGNPLGGWVGENTTVINEVTQEFPTQLPIYKISETKISELELLIMKNNLNALRTGSKQIEFRMTENSISGHCSSSGKDPVKNIDMTDEEIEARAWEALKNVPFLDGEYEYLGITSISSQGSSLENMTKYQVSVSFATLVNGIRVVGGEMINFSFDADGLCGVALLLYDYKKIGTMDMVSLEDASARINQPDAFAIDTEDGTITMGKVDTLEVEHVKLLLVNQHRRGCAILQPVYNFIGTATFADGSTAKFTSKVIAIPDKYTYEDPFDR